MSTVLPRRTSRRDDGNSPGPTVIRIGRDAAENEYLRAPSSEVGRTGGPSRRWSKTSKANGASTTARPAATRFWYRGPGCSRRSFARTSAAPARTCFVTPSTPTSGPSAALMRPASSSATRASRSSCKTCPSTEPPAATAAAARMKRGRVEERRQLTSDAASSPAPDALHSFFESYELLKTAYAARGAGTPSSLSAADAKVREALELLQPQAAVWRAGPRPAPLRIVCRASDRGRSSAGKGFGKPAARQAPAPPKPATTATPSKFASANPPASPSPTVMQKNNIFLNI